MRFPLPIVLAIVLVQVAFGGQEQAPRFRTAVDRVLVDVVVTDDNDRPVPDLKREDFAIVENRRAQTITDFRFVSVPLANRLFEAADRVAPASDVATNAPASELSRLWAIIVDDLHLIEAHIIPVKRILADLVRALPSQDEVAIVYVGRSDISVNFTSDSARLLRAIDKVRDAVGFGAGRLSTTRRPVSETAGRNDRRRDPLGRGLPSRLGTSATRHRLCRNDDHSQPGNP